MRPGCARSGVGAVLIVALVQRCPVEAHVVTHVVMPCAPNRPGVWFPGDAYIPIISENAGGVVMGLCFSISNLRGGGLFCSKIFCEQVGVGWWWLYGFGRF